MSTLAKHGGRALLATLGLGLLTLAAYRAGRVLSFDAYYYCEFAKLYTRQWPDAFGNHWPFGYPLLGGILARSGLGAYAALATVSAGAAFLLAGLLSILLEACGARQVTVGVLAIMAVPQMQLQLGGVMSELPFAAALAGMACLLGQPRLSGAGLFGAALLALLALCLRYAGVLALGVYGLWCLREWGELRARHLLGPALTAGILLLLAASLLLGWNQVVHGHLSGAERPAGMTGLEPLGQNLADLGWSIPSVIVGTGAASLCAPSSPAYWAGGLAFILLLLAPPVWSGLRSASIMERTLALTLILYAGGMIALHTISDFDRLSSARTFLPVWPMLAVLLWRPPAGWARHFRIAVAGCGVAGGLLFAFRGVSAGTGARVAPALPVLESRLQPTDRVAVNDDARVLSAYLRQPVSRLPVPPLRLENDVRFLLLAGHPVDRQGHTLPLAEPWKAYVKEQVRQGRFRFLLDTPTLVLLELVPVAP